MCVCGDGDRSRGRGAVGEQRRWREKNKQTNKHTGIQGRKDGEIKGHKKVEE